MSKPWKTTANIEYLGQNGEVSLSNTKIKFRKGDVWENQGIIIKHLNGMSPGDPLVIGTYGSGGKPIISGKSEITALFKPLRDNNNHIQNLWYCPMNADPGRIFDGFNQELMKGYDVKDHQAWISASGTPDPELSFNENKYDLGQESYSLINNCSSPSLEKNRWQWIASETSFWFNTSGNVEETVTIPANIFILYSEDNPNSTTLYKSTNSSPEWWRSSTNVQILECSNISISDIDFQGGRDCVAIGNLGEIVPAPNYISTNIKITNCNIGKYSYHPLEIRNSENITVNNNIFDSGYIKKVGLSKTNCKAYLYASVVDPNNNPGYFYSGSDRGTGDAVQLSYYAKNCEIYDNQFINWSHAAYNLVPGI